ncbi:MAG: hypothetical protein QME75_13645 [Deltaproteobacteria bacterium]|nr:hypothetical protein [Desulfitobacteriaceae bacterium]MDI6854635.1 hypothetical protein [Deltaproteobacteria bacterium]
MKPALGVSAFGLKDCVAQAGTGCHELDFYPTSAVLPTNPFGRILTGDEAYKDRTHTGLPWPPEARVQEGEHIRRCPISIVWRALVEAGDRMVRWDAGRGVSFSLARILAKHVEGLLKVNPLAVPFLTGTAESESSDVVVAIPNHLDEFGQDILLRELAALGFRNALLVWRPVAAALSWLDKVEGDFPVRMNENDHIHVIYLGLDAIEITTFKLRVKLHNNQYYVFPLRDRPKNLLTITGVDWSGRLIEELFTEIDTGAFWQAFIRFPEIWQALAGRSWNLSDLPRPWCRNGEWSLWSPDPDLRKDIYDTKVTDCITLREILKRSCQIDSHREPQPLSIRDSLQREVHRIAQLHHGGRLRGMIICGPLAQNTIPPWLSTDLNLLASRGLNIEGNFAEAEAGRLWLSAECEDPIAEGASIYGRRIAAGIPSYLDTMPQLSILAQASGRYTWVPLLNAQEVWGGEEHRDTIERRFQLDAGKRKLFVYLFRGPVDDAPVDPGNPFDPQEISSDDLSPCKARLIREVVRKHGSLEAIHSRYFFQKQTKEAQYGRAFAEAFFRPKSNEDTEQLEPKMPRTQLRRAVFDFPSAPERATLLDVEVRIRPASGLARIEILPEDASFLQGEKVRLNYSTMKPASKLPPRGRGWPRIEEVVVDPEDSVLQSNIRLLETFERTPPTSMSYLGIINDVRDLLKRTVINNIVVLPIKCATVDQDGKACTIIGNEILQRIAIKFEKDFRRLQGQNNIRLLKMVLSRAAWLYASTPSNIVDYIRDILRTGYTVQGWSSAAEAAGRAFIKVEDFRILFRAIARRAKSDPFDLKTFPINAARAICNVLMLRRNGERGLDRDKAQLFANRALQRLLKQQESRNFQMLYFQMVRLLLYLLRFRKIDPECFAPYDAQSISVFEKAKESMEFAKNLLPRHTPRVAQIKKIIEGFDKYLHYEGTEDVISVLRDLAESDT